MVICDPCEPPGPLAISQVRTYQLPMTMAAHATTTRRTNLASRALQLATGHGDDPHTQRQLAVARTLERKLDLDRLGQGLEQLVHAPASRP